MESNLPGLVGLVVTGVRWKVLDRLESTFLELLYQVNAPLGEP